ncbi:mitochondrial carrier [Crepidotus variabilis]|uniref:Mitochondrial carrier n=1 Tax=Crepidotus variabilis TaxID=179855 RepID=A0A9P6ES54_9AGAR|nr:mitochondrial carrier [Crepidotus variabilis]
MSGSKDKGKAPATLSVLSEGEELLIPKDRPYLPRLPSDPPVSPQPHSLAEFREREGRSNRKRKLQTLWRSLPDFLHEPHNRLRGQHDGGHLTQESAEVLQKMYDSELLDLVATHSSGSQSSPHVGWKEFKEFAEKKETELWHIFHDELDLDGNGQLDHSELRSALSKAGVAVSPTTVSDFILSLSSEPHSHHINFGDFRDFFILLPRKASPAEIYQYYEVRRYMGDDGRGPARVNMEGDVSLSAEDKPPGFLAYKVMQPTTQSTDNALDLEPDGDFHYLEDEVEAEHHFLEGHTALKFLFAGGVAGAVSRTCTAPFDRLKVHLITRTPELSGAMAGGKQAELSGIRTISTAVLRIYAEGGVLAFWVGNGLSVAKIFPESAIKFFSYESSKRAFAKYWDKVEDTRDISGFSRFVSGGLGGISSQLSIYPIETLKTQMMSTSGEQKRTLSEAVRHLWRLGGFRAYYRGLAIGLVGVFPYSAIDMSTFEALKLAYVRSTGQPEPGVLALLAFGSISGSVGATSVYPLNFVRTRLQASGSSGHPQIYTGAWDVARKTWVSEGWRGFYRGLFPTLAKVVPAVSISYVVYEHTKRKLGV